MTFFSSKNVLERLADVQTEPLEEQKNANDDVLLLSCIVGHVFTSSILLLKGP